MNTKLDTKSFKAVVICNQMQKFWFERIAKKYFLAPIVYINSWTAFKDWLVAKEKHNVDLYLIVPELDWYRNGKLPGIELALYLRMNNVREVFHFFTMLPNSAFREDVPLLKVESYHHVYFLPTLPETLLIDQMSVELLKDINSTLITVRQIVREILHEFNNNFYGNCMTFDKLSIAENINGLFLLINGISSINKSRLDRLKLQFIKDLESIFTLDHLLLLLEGLNSKILALTPEDQSDNDFDEKINSLTKWKALFLDDNLSIQKMFEEDCKKVGIQTITTSSGEEALKLLKDDVKNEIVLLLCDLRLLESDGYHWQRLQGYDIIQKVFLEYSNTLTFIVLSSARKRILQMRSHYNLNLNSYYKRDVFSSKGARSLFMQDLYKKGEETYFISRSQPQLSAWWNVETGRFYKPLANFYRDHLFSKDYYLGERNINEIASSYLSRYLSGEKPDERKFIITINDNGQPLFELNKFRYHILVGRRIAIALYLKGFTEKEIYHALHPKSLASDTTQMQKFLFNTTFALSFKKDLPKQKDIEHWVYLKSNLLIEEIEWILNSLNLGFDYDQLRLNHEDWINLTQILENLEDRVKRRLRTERTVNKKNKPIFLKSDNLSINNFKNTFDKAFDLAVAHRLTLELKRDLELDIEQINNIKIKTYLEKKISNLL